MPDKILTLAEFEKQFNDYYVKLDKPANVEGFMGNWAWYLHAKNEFRKQLEEQGITIK